MAAGIALVQTVDFFPPLCDDPYIFGQIAAANSLSDVYAMGGNPLTALNVVAFPDDKLPMEMLKEILRGGLDTAAEAGAAEPEAEAEAAEAEAEAPELAV